MKATKLFVQLSPYYTLFADRWLSAVKTQEDACGELVDFCGTFNTYRTGTFLSTLEISMKYWPRGSYLVMKSTPIVTGDRALIIIGKR